MGLQQTKKLLHSKGNYHKMKSQPSVWKKILANYIPDKGLIYKIHKELTTQHQKHNQPDFKMGRGSE